MSRMMAQCLRQNLDIKIERKLFDRKDYDALIAYFDTIPLMTAHKICSFLVNRQR